MHKVPQAQANLLLEYLQHLALPVEVSKNADYSCQESPEISLVDCKRSKTRFSVIASIPVIAVGLAAQGFLCLKLQADRANDQYIYIIDQARGQEG